MINTQKDVLVAKKIIGQENHFILHKICEAINIHVWLPTVNLDQGYTTSPNLWNKINNSKQIIASITDELTLLLL